MKGIGIALQKYRKEKNLSKSEISKKLDMNLQFYEILESGKVKIDYFILHRIKRKLENIHLFLDD